MNTIVGDAKGGGKMLILSLEPGNIHRLTEGKPILLHVEDMFPNGIPPKLELAIMYSETPVADAREMAKHADVALDERTQREKKIRPHCPECRSTIETLGVGTNASPAAFVFCPQCGCAFGVIAKAAVEQLISGAA